MFRQRLLTILVLMPLVLLALYFSNVWFFGSIILLLVLASGFEWLQLIPLQLWAFKISFLLLLLGFTLLEFLYLDVFLFINLVLWIAIFFAILSYPESQKWWGRPWVVMLAAFIVLPVFASSFLELFKYPQGKALVVYLLALIWAADIGAYLIGKFFGHKKLIPLVSPGKTVEGVVGGFIAGVTVGLVGYIYFKPLNGANWFIIAATTIVVSIIGDLFISMLKRRQHLKDTGHIFPGHGGILDRIDSLIAALPFFYFGLHHFPAGI
ncbi:phosphatidate cytidylyltransferase [Legionella adelaidensis]|uniref:Phosphatidate cytidylyltransferase n=1 Tax=Legionella adelaidensis TaxID=45056 RepID=A0A0W0R621_9GAMM|nr:phosphatidate cytidylyltransferase [Legionella adelaidensis]KTC66520.1 phosphatidate cytidylyltransferase [Legionella adelaidensis]